MTIVRHMMRGYGVMGLGELKAAAERLNPSLVVPDSLQPGCPHHGLTAPLRVIVLLKKGVCFIFCAACHPEADEEAEEKELPTPPVIVLQLGEKSDG